MKSLLAFVLVLTIFSSCCTKKGCVDVMGFGRLDFTGFQEADLDTIKIITCSPGSIFSVQIDSAEYINEVEPDDDKFRLYTGKELLFDKDYVIKIGSMMYTLGNFKTEIKVCNSCFGVPDEYSVLFSGYTLNSNEVYMKYGSSVTISK